MVRSHISLVVQQIKEYFVQAWHEVEMFSIGHSFEKWPKALKNSSHFSRWPLFVSNGHSSTVGDRWWLEGFISFLIFSSWSDRDNISPNQFAPWLSLVKAVGLSFYHLSPFDPQFSLQNRCTLFFLFYIFKYYKTAIMIIIAITIIFIILYRQFIIVYDKLIVI